MSEATERVMGLLEVDARSGVPIYLQLVEGLGHAVEVGTLGAGERLPTVRELAARLRVAPNTVVKAYGELQRQGLISSRPGVGTVVSGSADEAARGRKLEALHGRIGDLVRDAIGLGLTQDELWERLDAEFERRRKRDRGARSSQT
jgi:GntR family transcriptional regulator